MQEVLRANKATGVDQRTLAARAGVAPETISRAKKQGHLDIRTLAALARASGMELCLRPLAPETAVPIKRRSSLADPVWGLAWSNPNLSDEVLVRNALAKGTFLVILEAVLEHGMAFVRTQWNLMLRSDEPPSLQVQSNVRRILGNIERGISNAQT